MQIKKINKQSLAEAAGILRRGGTVVYPTETAYALGADATNAKAAAKIFKIKKRPKEKGLPVICCSKKQVEKFFEMPDAAWKIWKKYYPKPVSIILQIQGAPLHLCKFRQTQGCPLYMKIPVRISSHRTARDLARKLGRPIVSTSANISGAGAIYDAKEIAEIFSKEKYKPNLILDGGKIPAKPPSTIIKIDNKKIIVLRQGEVRIR